MDLTNELQCLNREGKSLDEILHFLVLRGLSITDAIVAVRALYGINLAEAKKIVASSRHWEDVHRDHESLHDMLEAFVDDCHRYSAYSMNMNAINIIAPYKYLDMWVFDDARVGLTREPFVGGADTMIDRVVADIENAEGGFVMLFSGTPFPGYGVKLEWRRADGGGNWYYSEQLGMEGWLCPALFRYFAETPPEIFVQVKPKAGC